MPASLEAALVFAVLIVPGLLLIRGYNRTRAHTLPGRDLYAVGQAIVVSLAWLPVVWVLGGRCVLDWLIAETAADHQTAILGIVVGNLAAAQLGGFAAGLVMRAIGERPETWLAEQLDRFGVFDPPTAWDELWLTAREAQWAAVEINLKNGEQYNAIFDDGSTIGLSPAPRQLFFDTEYHWGGTDGTELILRNTEGLFIDGAEIESVRLVYLHF